MAVDYSIAHKIREGYRVFSVSDLWFTSDNADSSKKFFVYNFFSDYDFLFDVIRVIEDEDMQKRPFWQSAVLNEFNKNLKTKREVRSLIENGCRKSGENGSKKAVL